MNFTSSRTVCLITLLGGLMISADVKEELEPFLEYYCYDCHGGGIKKGGLDLEEKDYNLADLENAHLWEHALQRVELGEMPPDKEDAPTPEEKEEFVSLLRPQLLAAARERRAEDGRGPNRRLTRTEYQNSVHELLGITTPLTSLLPHDSEGHGFHSVSSSQQLSSHTMDSYLEASAYALDNAFQTLFDFEKLKFHRTFNAQELTHYNGKTRGPQLWKGNATFWKHNVVYNGRLPATTVQKTGMYRITLNGVKALNAGEDRTVWGMLQVGHHITSNPLTSNEGLIEATTQPQNLTYECWMEEGELLRIWNCDSGERDINSKGFYEDGWFFFTEKDDIESQGAGGISLQSITMEMIHPKGKRQHIRNNLLMNIPSILDIPEEDSEKHYRNLITSFAQRAWRRPVQQEEIAPYIALAQSLFKTTPGEQFAPRFVTGLKVGYQAILCSPHFLTLVIPENSLGDHELASRLSYALTSSPPDATLTQLANEGKLTSPQVMKDEVTRLLSTEKTRKQFIQTFTDQWLDIDQMDATSPDTRKYWYFDPILQESLTQETQLFVEDLVKNNMSVRNLLKSDFLYLNSRLSRHYHTTPTTVLGKGMQRIPVTQSSRSGLLTQGAILKVTADGAVTSPVLRGVWVGERILGRHISPPPPNIPAIEPDIRGAKSIKEQLAKHSSSASCKSCHMKIDPPGFALESFDPTGRERSHYGKVGSSAPVDTAGITLDGFTFTGYNQWRDHQVKNPEQLARNFVNQFITYATGSPIGFADQEDVTDILAQAKHSQYGVKDLIIHSVLSPLFHNR